MKNILQNVNKQALIESGRDVFSAIGIGSSMAYMAGMHIVLGVFSGILVFGAWYGMYVRYQA